MRAIADGEPIDLGEVTTLASSRRRAHDLDVIVDRLVVKGDSTRVRATDSVELALRLGDGKMLVQEDAPAGKKPKRTWHSERFACEKDDFTFPEIEPRLFSFNTIEGACPTCEGSASGSSHRIAHRSRSVAHAPPRNAVDAWGRHRLVAAAVELKRASDATGVDVDVTWDAARRSQRPSCSAARAPKKSGRGAKAKGYEGVVRWIERQLQGGEDVENDARLDDDGRAPRIDALEATRAVRPLRDVRRRVPAAGSPPIAGGWSIAALGACRSPCARARRDGAEERRRALAPWWCVPSPRRSRIGCDFSNKSD